MAGSFVHLHLHSHYSLLDGACRIADVVKRAKELGMDSLAITDHGCMFGVIDFFNECKKEGIKPILGMEAYMAPGDRRERQAAIGEAAYHVLLLAQNLEGYKNLVKLSSIAYREGFYYKPRIDKEILRQFHTGLIGTSACLGGEIPSAFVKRDMKAARAVAETYLDIFGPDRFFIEVQKHIPEQDLVNPELAELAGKLGIGLVATNDVHFLRKDDHFAHDVLCCISMGRQVNDESRLKYSPELYLKSPQEMRAALGNFPEAIENTVRIAAMCSLDLDFSKKYAPVYHVAKSALRPDFVAKLAKTPAPAHPPHEDEIYLRQLCDDGLLRRYGTAPVTPEVRQRLNYELDVISKKNFCSYFLIVWDFCNFARSNNIPVGARGSGVGTLVGYLLGLCNVDPLRYNLLFERFMDPNRNEMPDIDIDICQAGRPRVIDYVRQKYGHVAQIITFGTLAAKAACKDVGRVLGIPLAEVDKLTKLIPSALDMTLEKALKQVPELATLYRDNAAIRQVIDTAQRLEGMCRNAGCHAAGVIIADQPLENLLPLYKDSDDHILTQFEGPTAEKCGMLKMDFLGLRTLTTVQRAVDLEFSTRKIRPLQWSPQQPPPPLDSSGRIDLEHLDLADKNVLALFRRGETRGIFQFESGGMQDLLLRMQPDRLEDLIAANALYRPGPMALISSYCARKHGREPVPAVHPVMDSLLTETYGIMVYQEQVMQIFNKLGGIELSNAYKLIKAISKKKPEIIDKFRPDFMKGAMANGITNAKAEELFKLILEFAGYGFNKAHSTGYAIIAFQTAYMKTYHPVEYMTALLTFEMGNTDKMVEYIEECRRLALPDGARGIKVLPPDINISDRDFTPVYVEATAPRNRKSRGSSPAIEGVIRFGLMAVRGVGEKAVEAIIEQRRAKGPFASLYDFTERVDLKHVNRATLEALIKCGAFSSLGGRRAQLLHVLDSAIEMGQQSQQDRRSGQMNMFAALASEHSGTSRAPSIALPDIPEFDAADLLKFEKELLGFYITSHPLAEHQAILDRYTTATTKEALAARENTEVIIGGMMARVRKTVTKNGRSAGQQMAMITLEDLEGQIDGTLFAETLSAVNLKYPNAISKESIVFIKGKVDKKRETPSILINEVIPLADAPARMTTAIVLKLDRTRHDVEVLRRLKPLLARHRGPTPVFVQVSSNGDGSVLLSLPKDQFIRFTPAMVSDLELLLGAASVEPCGPGTRRAKRIAQQQLFAASELDTPAPDSVPVTPDDEQLASLELETELAV